MIVPTHRHVSAQIHRSVGAQRGGDVGMDGKADGLHLDRALRLPLVTGHRHDLHRRSRVGILRRNLAGIVEHDLVVPVAVEISQLVLDENGLARVAGVGVLQIVSGLLYRSGAHLARGNRGRRAHRGQKDVRLPIGIRRIRGILNGSVHIDASHRNRGSRGQTHAIERFRDSRLGHVQSGRVRALIAGDQEVGAAHQRRRQRHRRQTQEQNDGDGERHPLVVAQNAPPRGT